MSVLNNPSYSLGFSLLTNNAASIATHSLGLFNRVNTGTNSIKIAVTIANLSGRLFDIICLSSSFAINRFHTLTAKENIFLGVTAAVVTACLTPNITTCLLEAHPLFQGVVVHYTESLFYSFLPILINEAIVYADTGKLPTVEAFRK